MEESEGYPFVFQMIDRYISDHGKATRVYTPRQKGV